MESTGESRVVYFRVQQRSRCEVACFQTNTPTDELKELFRSAAEAGPRDILKLYTPAGRLINISSALSPNSPQTCYSLQVVAAHCNGMLLDEVGIDLMALEERVERLEKQMRVDFDQLPPIVQDLKCQVDNFRNKLETTEHLSWLGFYKQLPPPLSTEACRRLQYRRKSDEQKRRVREKFFSICDVAMSDKVRKYLRQPTFDCHQWEDEEILLLLQQMYVDLELTNKFGIELPILRSFLYEVYKNYNEVPFHNFRHCFCVAQMMYAMIWCVDLPRKIGDLETLILLTSCICHDLDHPGYNNIYQINAKTELALRYNDISPLENHHCSVAFRVLESDDCNIFRTFPSETFREVREGVIRCILATDMARHNEILGQFKEIMPEFDFKNKAHTNLLSMVMIKVADISNEARPMDVAEPWLDRLLQEFFKQSDAEKLEGLPVTPFMDREKITKPSSQCSFIGFVLLPLFESLGQLFTELQDFIVQPVRDALHHYRRLNEAAKDERLHRKSIAELSDGSSTPVVVKSVSSQSVKSRHSLGTSSRSRSIDEDELAPDGTMMEDAEEMEEGEEETVTEVEVSEKTLKFKISTEGNMAGRKSYPGSRKGSREKTQFQDYHHHELAQAIRDQEKDGAFRNSTTPTSPPPDCPSSYKLRSNSVPVSPSVVRALSSEESARKGGELCNGETKCFEGGQQDCAEGSKTQDAAESSVAEHKECAKLKKPTLLSRIRTLTDRLSFSSDSYYDASSSPPSRADDATHRAMTLPKTKRKGWKGLIDKSYTPSSSLELLSPVENSSPQQNKKKVSSDNVSPRSTSRVVESPERNVLSGSLDSILKERNRKKLNLWSSPGTKRGFLSRLGRSNTHSEGTRPCASESKTQQHNWMASLAASFRSKKNHHHHHHHHQHHLQKQE